MQKTVLAFKNWFQPANGMQSTRSLVEIHNSQYLFSNQCLEWDWIADFVIGELKDGRWK